MTYQFINDNYFCVYQRQGNDINGNPIFLVNFFKRIENKTDSNKFNSFDVCLYDYCNYNYCLLNKKDKHGNIKIQSYDITEDIKRLFNTITD